MTSPLLRVTWSRATSVHDDPSVSVTPRRSSCLVAYRCASFENAPSGASPRSTMMTWAADTSVLSYRMGITSCTSSARAAAISTPGPGPDHDEVERARVDQARVGLHIFEDLQDAGADPLGVREGIEGERELLGARRVEEVRLGSGGDHQEFALDHFTAGECDGVPPWITRGDLVGAHFDVIRVGEHLIQVERDVARRQLSRGDLVQQRLELMEPVLVEQSGAHAFGSDKLLGAGYAGETAADDEHTAHLRLAQCSAPDLTWLRPYSAALEVNPGQG
jgi:hypothetical protein